MAALRQSPDIIAKVGNSYKKRLKVASRVEMFPKLLEEIQKQRDAMQQAKRFDKKTAEWRSHIKEVAKPKFGGTEEEWRRWCSEILEPYADRLWDKGCDAPQIKTNQSRCSIEGGCTTKCSKTVPAVRV